MRRIIHLVVFSMALWTLPATAMAAPPGNDNLAGATPVTAIPTLDSVAVGEATTEPGEIVDTCAPFANTVWYAVTMSADTTIRVDTAGSNYDTAVAVWTGTGFDDASLIACVDDTSIGLQAAVRFNAVAGNTYLVQVGSFFEAHPEAVLEISFDKPKAANRPMVFKNTFRGSVADAFVESYDETTETYAFQSVQVVDGTWSSKGSRPLQQAFLSVNTSESHFDEVNQVLTYTDWFGAAELSDNQFAIDRRYRSATVDAGVTMFGSSCVEDFLNGTLECTDLGEAHVDVSVDWTGTGSVARSSSTEAFGNENFRLRFQGRSTSRQADVTGGTTGDKELSFDGAVGRIAREASGSWFWVSDETSGGFFGPGGSVFGIEAFSTMSTIAIDRFSGQFADANSFEYDETTGTYTGRNVGVVQGKSKTRGDRWVTMDEMYVDIWVENYDEATNTYTFTSWFGTAEPDNVRFGRRLSTASASGTVELFGTRCVFVGESADCEDLGAKIVHVDAAWTGVGSTYSSRSSYSERVDGTGFTFRGTFTGREATVTGHITGDLPGSLDGAYGQLGSQAQGSWYRG